MLLTIIIGTILILFITAFVVFKKSSWGLIIEFILLPLWLIGIFCFHNIPITDFPYEAKIQLPEYEKPITLYISEFTQEENKIIIEKYATWEIHMFDFKGYDEHGELEVTLLDNDNKFIYTDRATGIEYGRTESTIGATQY